MPRPTVKATVKDFALVSSFQGYRTKPDETNTDARFLVDQSQNVIINDAEKVAIRKGYTLYGAANGALTPIVSSFVWQNSSGQELALRSYADRLEWYNSNAWTLLENGFGKVAFVFTTFWDTVQFIDRLLFVRGNTGTIYDWSGGVATFASATAATITNQGTVTWDKLRFLTAGTRKIRIVDTGGTVREFTYTGGENTNTLTGITPDPTAFIFAVGATVYQSIITNGTLTGVDSGYLVDIIATLNNQVYIGSKTSNRVFVSKDSGSAGFTNFSPSSPRVPGEGAVLTLDGICTGLVPQEDQMYISAGKNFWYQTQFRGAVNSSGSPTEELLIKPLKTSTGQGAKSHDLIARIKNSAVFISNELTLDELGRVENILGTPQSLALSDPIKPDFTGADFTNGHIAYWRNQIFISDPNNSKVYIYDLNHGFWQPPQILPVGRFSIIGGLLYGHSSAVAETYQLFNGTNDNGKSTTAVARFSYLNFGKRFNLKRFTRWFTEGYITANTKITMNLYYDWRGFRQTLSQVIDGSDEGLIFEIIPDDSLGTNPLGDVSLSGDTISSDLPKFRVIGTFPPQDFFEIQVEYITDAIDQQWQILAFGPAVQESDHQPVAITR